MQIQANGIKRYKLAHGITKASHKNSQEILDFGMDQTGRFSSWASVQSGSLSENINQNPNTGSMSGQWPRSHATQFNPYSSAAANNSRNQSAKVFTYRGSSTSSGSTAIAHQRESPSSNKLLIHRTESPPNDSYSPKNSSGSTSQVHIFDRPVPVFASSHQHRFGYRSNGNSPEAYQNHLIMPAEPDTEHSAVNLGGISPVSPDNRSVDTQDKIRSNIDATAVAYLTTRNNCNTQGNNIEQTILPSDRNMENTKFLNADIEQTCIPENWSGNLHANHNANNSGSLGQSAVKDSESRGNASSSSNSGEPNLFAAPNLLMPSLSTASRTSSLSNVNGTGLGSGYPFPGLGGASSAVTQGPGLSLNIASANNAAGGAQGGLFNIPNFGNFHLNTGQGSVPNSARGPNPNTMQDGSLDGWINSVGHGQIEMVEEAVIKGLKNIRLTRDFSKENCNANFQQEIKEVFGQDLLDIIFQRKRSQPPVNVDEIKQFCGAGLNHEFIMTGYKHLIKCIGVRHDVPSHAQAGEAAETEFLRKKFPNLEVDQNICFPVATYRGIVPKSSEKAYDFVVLDYIEGCTNVKDLIFAYEKAPPEVQKKLDGIMLDLIAVQIPILFHRYYLKYNRKMGDAKADNILINKKGKLFMCDIISTFNASIKPCDKGEYLRSIQASHGESPVVVLKQEIEKYFLNPYPSNDPLLNLTMSFPNEQRCKWNCDILHALTPYMNSRSGILRYNVNNHLNKNGTNSISSGIGGIQLNIPTMNAFSFNGPGKPGLKGGRRASGQLFTDMPRAGLAPGA